MLTRRAFLSTSAVAAALTLSRPRAAFAAAPPFPDAKYAQTNGIRMAYYEMGGGSPVIFSHGFPELAYSWRHQLPALAKAGFRAIAPDQRGYGLTDRPEKVEDYSLRHICGDLVGLMDSLKIDKAVFCGHDWGGMIVWSMPLLHPDRVAGVIGVNTPFIPRSPMKPLDLMKQMRGENNYIVAFQKPGVADAVLAKDVRKTFSVFLRESPMTAEQFAKLPANAPERNFELLSMIENADLSAFPGKLIVSPEELDFYVNTFEKTGFTGGINWYRNIDRNWEDTANVKYHIDQPCLYVGAEDDVVLPPSMAEGIQQWAPNIEKHVIQDCGHWTQQEHPDELNTILIDWLKKTFPVK